jgi:prevent-host-death family protein
LISSHEGGSVHTIGIQELRDNLSRYLEELSQGKTFTITRHGKPIAQLVPIRGESALERLVAEGKVTPPRQRKGTAPTPTATDGPVSDLIDEQRR